MQQKPETCKIKLDFRVGGECPMGLSLLVIQILFSKLQNVVTDTFFSFCLFLQTRQKLTFELYKQRLHMVA